MKNKDNRVRKVTPGLFPIDSVKVLPSPDPEKVLENMRTYRATIGDFDYNELM
jgi:hypothetical protein